MHQLNAPSPGRGSKGVALSQHDDWLHRGDDPIVRDMNLYVYSMWVYRVENNLTATPRPGKDKRPPADRHVELEFDEGYPSRETFKQRLAVEPRVPMIEGMQFISETNAEAHYMLQSILFRPVFLPSPAEDEARSERLLRAYRALCTPPPGQPPWPAQNMGPGQPGPFQRGWELFRAEQTAAAQVARDLTRRAAGLGSLWRTAEVRDRLAKLSSVDVPEGPPGFEPAAPCPSVAEYAALVTLQTSANFARIAEARTEPRQRREAEDAVAVPEAAVAHGGDGDDGEADGQVEAAATRAEAERLERQSRPP